MQNNQAQEAEQFAKANGGRISAIKKRLIESGREFLRGLSSDILPATVVAALNEMLEKAEPVGFGMLLRQNASYFALKRRADEYWPLVDSCVFLSDALGTHWQYLPMSGRDQFLTWIEMFLDEAEAGINLPVQANATLEV